MTTNPMTPQLAAAIERRMRHIPCFYQPEEYTVSIGGKTYRLKTAITITEVEEQDAENQNTESGRG